MRRACINGFYGHVKILEFTLDSSFLCVQSPRDFPRAFIFYMLPLQNHVITLIKLSIVLPLNICSICVVLFNSYLYF
jgi:hypothetical protein